MAAPLTAAMPPDLDLDINYTIRFAAISPTDGSSVGGVVVSEASIFAQNLSGAPIEDLSFGNFVPLLTPVQLDDQQEPEK